MVLRGDARGDPPLHRQTDADPGLGAAKRELAQRPIESRSLPREEEDAENGVPMNRSKYASAGQIEPRERLVRTLGGPRKWRVLAELAKFGERESSTKGGYETQK
jgi:hypothetical protein